MTALKLLPARIAISDDSIIAALIALMSDAQHKDGLPR